MNDSLSAAVISAVISLIVAGITSWFSAKLAWKSEIKKRLYDKREEAYYNLFDLMLLLRDNPCFLFNYEQMISPFMELRTQLNMYASHHLIELLEPFYNKMCSIYSEYANRFEADKYACCEENESSIELQTLEENYEEAHKIPVNEIIDIQGKLISIMRKDLGNKGAW